jgi:peroxiredoxin (alkyl hydroperoxide reductase subunit C)
MKLSSIFALLSSALLTVDAEAIPREPAPKFFNLPAVVNNDFTQISLDDYKDKYVVLVFYPFDFTYVCPTELIAFSDSI